jgi:hypothetical protein
MSYSLALYVFLANETKFADEFFNSNWLYWLVKPFYLFYNMIFHLCFQQHLLALFITILIPNLLYIVTKKLVLNYQLNGKQGQRVEMSNPRLIMVLLFTFLSPAIAIPLFFYYIFSLSVLANSIEFKHDSVFLLWNFGTVDHVYLIAIGYFTLTTIVNHFKKNRKLENGMSQSFIGFLITIPFIVIFSFLPFCLVLYFICEKLLQQDAN